MSDLVSLSDADARHNGNWFSEARDGFAGVGRTLWVCRVPLLSVALGLFFFASTPQAQDLFTELNGDIAKGLAYWSSVYLLSLVAWIVPVYASARLSVEAYLTLPCKKGSLGTIAPRAVPLVLALLCAFAILLGQIGALQNLHLITGDRTTILTMFSHYFAGLGAIVQEIVSGDIIRRTVSVDVLSQRQMVTMPIVTVVFFFASWALLVAIGRIRWFNAIFLVYGLVLTAVCIVIVCLDPTVTTRLLNRALLMPFLLGAWVPALTALGYLSFRFRLPLLVFLILGIGCAGLFRSTANDVRHTDSVNANLQISLGDAIASWRRANSCAGTIADCPPPLIVVASGGASRAAFFATTVLGDIMDRSNDGAAYNPLRNQLFAISAVSGGSLGAAVFSAALHTSEKGGVARTTPCRPYEAIRHDLKAGLRLWHVALEKDAHHRLDSYNKRWRDCLQMVTAGDFISPVFVGLAFTDLLQLNQRGDRARILERAWEQRYAAVTGADELARPFSQFGPTPSNWRPILLLNATSVETGRRIIVSNLRPSRCVGGYKRRIFEDAYDFYELTGSSPSQGRSSQVCHCEGDHLQCTPSHALDIPLSTAVSISARFPIISPPANIRNADGRLVDLAVDGGYFENYGATTALELAEVLSKERLKPVVLQINNSPEFGELSCLHPTQDAQAPTAPDIGRVGLFAGLRAPIRGVVQTRDARGNHATIRLCNWTQVDERASNPASRLPAGEALPQRFANVRVYPAPKRMLGIEMGGGLAAAGPTDEEPRFTQKGSIKQLSMSWWLSKTLQRYLDSQLPASEGVVGSGGDSDVEEEPFIRKAQARNAQEMDKILRALKRK